MPYFALLPHIPVAKLPIKPYASVDIMALISFRIKRLLPSQWQFENIRVKWCVANKETYFILILWATARLSVKWTTRRRLEDSMSSAK
jgi:hypothetical protein